LPSDYEAEVTTLDMSPLSPHAGAGAGAGRSKTPLKRKRAASDGDNEDGEEEGDEAGNDSDDSAASTQSLLLHPAHKHAHDTPQCILAQDWYEEGSDRPTWLLLVKWKNKPVAECSWEERDSVLIAGFRKTFVTTYLKTVEDKHIRDCIRTNTKP
jgi:hypothetical protein